MPTDPFTAISEPRRRAILVLLSGGERPVNDIARTLDLTQPQVSKDLKVLREAGLVKMRPAGRRRVYRVDPGPLKPVHDWTRTFERFWDDRLARVKARAEAAGRRAGGPPTDHPADRETKLPDKET
jgi:DNA-binding transcriptional ArsR family regulator